MKTKRTLPVQALFVVGLLSAGLQAQSVGIGTATPHPSARLHIEDNARGLLIPNVALTATNVAAPVTGPATSLLVYNTNTAGTGATAVTPGFYYWDGIHWVRLLGAGDAWLLTGNAGTDPAVNFLGTTDNNSLRIRVNNQQTFQFNTNFSIQRDDDGDPRGPYAVDLQRVRSAATQVASGNYSVIGGGEDNTASRDYATVGGGFSNTASGRGATVGGGFSNTASGTLATVGGGFSNTASRRGATVGGGFSNTARGALATVGGGDNNTASSDYATVGGGQSNTASRDYATVGGGRENTASGGHATVGGGRGNTASGALATVGGGQSNTASGDYSVVPGGYSNTANANYNLVFGENVDPSVTETHRVYFFGDGSDVNTPNPSGFLVINRLDGDFPIHVGTNGTNGNGAHLTGGGQWTDGSSRSFKERFVQYRPAEVLEKILQLPVEGYFYKGTKEYHITPMAEDFYRLFGTGVHEIIETDATGQLVRRPNPDVDKYLAASDVAGVALLGVQALHEENAQLRQRVADLETENAQLRQQISDIRTENAALRARLERLETLMQRIASTQTSP
jgi:FtsZ-binding cell division protein ZapB